MGPMVYRFFEKVNRSCASSVHWSGAVLEGYNIGRKDNTHAVKSHQGHDVGRKIAPSSLSPVRDEI